MNTAEPACTRPGDLSTPAGVRLTVLVYLVDCLARYRQPSAEAAVTAAGCKTSVQAQQVTAEYERRLPDMRAAWRKLQAMDRKKKAGTRCGTVLVQGDLIGDQHV
jgi:hypothetical protein